MSDPQDPPVEEETNLTPLAVVEIFDQPNPILVRPEQNDES